MRFSEYMQSRRKVVFFAAAALTIGGALGVAAAATGHLHAGPWPMASIKAAWVLASTLRRKFLTLLHIFSIGLRSGE